jgi:4-amino-4-deoxy-L-arabinose transferase-like glycosyltransferase
VAPSRGCLTVRRSDRTRLRRRTGARRWWAVAGTVLGVAVAVAGLAVLGFFIVLLVAFNSYASNK